MKKYAIFSMDVEDFSEIYCLKDKKNKDEYPSMMDGLDIYLDILDKHNIKGTFFVLASRLDKDKERLQEVINRGHNIGIHGYEHVLPSSESLDDFIDHVGKAKQQVEETLGIDVMGFRAPGFSLTQEEMDVLPSLGFSYDASEMDYSLSTYGADLHTEDFDKIIDGVYKKDSFFEFKMPKSIGHPLYGMPISGGAYLRLPPAHFVNRVLLKSIKAGSFYSFYVHPFELSQVKTPKVGYIGPLKKMYLNKRKHYVEIIEKLIATLEKEGYEFTTYERLVEENKS